MMIRRSVSIAAMLVAAGLAFGQQPPAKKDTPKEPAKPTPGSLEDTLEKALKNSADIRAAEAKVRDAEAQANRVRSQVLTKATSLHTNLNVAKRMLMVAEELFARTKSGLEKGTIPQAEFLAAQSTLEKARGEVELIETELKSLRGEFAIQNIHSAAFSPDGTRLYANQIDGALRVWDTVSGNILLRDRAAEVFGPYSVGLPAHAVEPTMADRVRKLLDQTIDFQTVDATPAAALRSIIDESRSGVPLRVMLGKAAQDQTFEISGNLPIGALFQAIEDSDANLRIIIRDYGLLLTTKDKIPDGALRVADFWKAKEPKPKTEPKPPEKK
jgi:hypothetical protein